MLSSLHSRTVKFRGVMKALKFLASPHFRMASRFPLHLEMLYSAIYSV